MVDFIVISAKGSESIREYIRPLAIISNEDELDWNPPAINKALAPLGLEAPVLQGTIRGFATSSDFKRNYPQRFAFITAAMKRTLENPELQTLLKGSSISARWTGPEKSEKIMKFNFEASKQYSYLLQL